METRSRSWRLQMEANTRQRRLPHCDLCVHNMCSFPPYGSLPPTTVGFCLPLWGLQCKPTSFLPKRKKKSKDSLSVKLTTIKSYFNYLNPFCLGLPLLPIALLIMIPTLLHLLIVIWSLFITVHLFVTIPHAQTTIINSFPQFILIQILPLTSYGCTLFLLYISKYRHGSMWTFSFSKHVS